MDNNYEEVGNYKSPKDVKVMLGVVGLGILILVVTILVGV